MNETITLARKDLQLLLLDRTSLIVAFVLPLVLIAVFGSVFASSFPADGPISSYDYIFSKVMFWGLIGGVASSVASMATEKSSGTIIRLQLSPVTSLQVILGKCLACVTLLVLSSVLSWVFATVLFGVKTNSHLTLLVVFISNAICFAGLMTFLANFVKTERAASALSWSVLQVMATFSGIMFPVAIMPSWMISMTNFNPVTWAVKAMEVALWKDASLQEILLPLAVPLFTGLAFFGLSVFFFRWNID